MFVGHGGNVNVNNCMVMVSRTTRFFIFFFQAEGGMRELVRSRLLGDVYKGQAMIRVLGWMLS